MSNPTKQDAIKLLDVFDPEMATLLHREEKRQFETIGLIASENVVSPMASCLEGSAFTNKNTEGYAGKRFVGGCQLADQAELLNETMKYFQEQESFSMDDFSEKVIRQPEVVESFTRFRQEYEQDRDIRIEDEFGISDSAVKKQARSYKSVIKLDRNFHIYVHGNRSLLEQGEDEKGKFYKVYYEEEE